MALNDEQIVAATSRIERLKADLFDLTSVDIVHKHVLAGESLVLGHDAEFDLRGEIASNFGIRPTDCHVVGSAKMGFTIKPQRRWGFFGDESDIDIAIVSDRLFDEVWLGLLRVSEQGSFWRKRDQFQSSLFQGWIRPDRWPSGDIYPFADKWWEFFRILATKREYGELKISAGLYRTMDFLEIYQSRCVDQCRLGEQVHE